MDVAKQLEEVAIHVHQDGVIAVLEQVSDGLCLGIGVNLRWSATLSGVAAPYKRHTWADL